MAAILLLGESCPYRNKIKSRAFDNSQGELIASACGLTREQLLQVVDTHYLLNRFFPSEQHDTLDYQSKLKKAWYARSATIINSYDFVLCVGKRLGHEIVGLPFNTFFDIQLNKYAIIPNPLAWHWWNDSLNVKQVGFFLTGLFSNMQPT